MKTVNTGKCELVFVKVLHEHDYCGTSKGNVQRIEDHKYSFIGFTDELTEDECKELVKKSIFEFTDGTKINFNYQESFHKLLSENNITGRHIVLRKIEE